MQTKPTVGRIVLYKPLKKTPDEISVLPAIIFQVHEDDGIGTAVDLQVFGTTDSMQFVVEQGDAEGQWDWMPFQKDQMARLAPGTANDSHPEAK